MSLDENTDKSIEEIKDIIRSRFEVARDVLREDDLDYLELTIFYTDNIEHFMWQFMGTESKYSNVIEDVYRLIDSEIGKMLEILDESTYFFVVSDHGMQELKGWFDLNKWLLDKGYIEINKGNEFSVQSSLLKLLNSVGIDQTKAFQIGKGSLGGMISKIVPFRKIADLYFRLETGEGRESRMNFAENMIDWEKTDAFMLGDGMLVLNEVDEKKRKKLIEDLMEIENPRTGKRLLRDIKNKEELFEGPYLDNLPDIFLIPSPGYFFTSSINLKSQDYWDYEPRNGLSGEHKSEGIMIAHGAEIRQGENIDKMEIYDFVPTLLHIFDRSVPEDLTGEVRKEIFKEGSTLREKGIESRSSEKMRIKEKLRKMKV
ncbi:hypothetical protein AKJ65_03685 [candidate division MSBL1 archaeon SCGC-AAA259E19]|uniref:Phosphodiesterase n=1 Tax=candidate division MSBL1 archaeon SCGC-AAA259E19 TaxID=1698264 RepID=A0A133UKH9_9EURY|nr:hypothetical protein AKJ65_03685 [candidate division MSBL1 archaeon SCGC-AAA259E19]